MAFHPISGITSDPGSGVFPSLIYVQGNEQRSIVMNRTPFSVGRKVDKDPVSYTHLTLPTNREV